MRVVAGSAKGVHLKAPASGATRPTSDFVRGAVFDLLENRADDWDRVLDLFAGSGALGIEALSRGAGWADLVDQDPRACRAVRDNLAAAHLTERAQVHQTSAAKALGYLSGPYGLVFLDPPYHDISAYKVLDTLVRRKLLSPMAVVVVEHATRTALPPPEEPLHTVLERRYGDTTVTLLMVEEGATVDHRGLPGDV